MIQFDEFLKIVDQTYNNHVFELRYGQTVMNVLNKIWPEKYHEMTTLEYDCFYDDGLVNLTLDKLKKEWT